MARIVITIEDAGDEEKPDRVVITGTPDLEDLVAHAAHPEALTSAQIIGATVWKGVQGLLRDCGLAVNIRRTH